MARYSFPALMQPFNQGYRVVFPDLPHCGAFGPNRDAALQNATDALFSHLLSLHTEGQAIPAPMEYGDRIIQPGWPADAVWTFLSVELAETSERVNVYLARGLLEKIDRLAGAQGSSRSSFISTALTTYADALEERLRARQVGQLAWPQIASDNELMLKVGLGAGKVILVDGAGRVLGLGDLTSTYDGKPVVVVAPSKPPLLQLPNWLG